MNNSNPLSRNLDQPPLKRRARLIESDDHHGVQKEGGGGPTRISHVRNGRVLIHDIRRGVRMNRKY